MLINKTAEERKRFSQLCADTRAAREAMRKATLVKPIVVEIPFAKPEAAPEGPRCCRLHPDGRPCELPAMEGYKECLRHFRWHSLSLSVRSLPFPEDGLSLQETLANAVDLVMSQQITADEARAVAELCRVMEKNLGRCERELGEIARRGLK
jgi:hypothetical protein